MDIVKASELWRKQIAQFYTGGTISELLSEGSHREIRKTVEAAIIEAATVKMSAAEAIRRGQDTIDYYVKEQGWTEDYAREHAEVVFSSAP